jgi:hypothetical protein
MEIAARLVDGVWIRSFTERWLMTPDGVVHRTEQTTRDGFNVWTWDAACPSTHRKGAIWVKVPPPPGTFEV